MRSFLIFILALTISVSGLVCKSESQTMSLEDYAKIEAEINIPDPELDPELVEKVSSKYGFSFEQYRDFSKKVADDASLREKLGEIRLKEQKK